MLEDYFFAQTADGRGSKVDTLPGGENLGQIDDLRYFNNKLLRGLRIPSSYLPTGPEDGSAQYNDGKVGVAYIQEFRFAKYVERLQKQIEEDLDNEFKMFLKKRGIEIDNSDFKIAFNKPMNFSSYRELQLDAERANLYTTLQNTPHLANQFKLKKYLGLTDTEIKENEMLWRQENGAEKFNDDENLTTLKNIGIRAASETSVNTDLGTEDLEGIEPTPDQQGAEAAATAGTEAPAAAPTAPGAGI